jgi:hypothetical protein
MSKHAATYAARDTLRDGEDGTSPDAVRRAYDAGANEHWRAFLKVLAHEAKVAKGGPVDWQVLCNQVGITRREGAGMLGAAQKRLSGVFPFTRESSGDNYRFTMREDVADMVIDLAKAQG